MATVAFLGTGLLGGAMAEGMLRRGDAVTVWNRTEAKARALEAAGARVAATPGDAVEGVERVHMTLPDDAVVEELMAAAIPRLGPDATVIDHSTTSPRGTKARVARMQDAGVRFVHAPVFMSPQMARDAVGIMLVSGPQPVFEAVRGELEKMTGEVWYLGEQGRRRCVLQDFRQLDALRHRRRCRRRVRDGQRPRHRSGGCDDGLLEVPARAASSSRAARRWRAATSARASS